MIHSGLPVSASITRTFPPRSPEKYADQPSPRRPLTTAESNGLACVELPIRAPALRVERIDFPFWLPTNTRPPKIVGCATDRKWRPKSRTPIEGSGGRRRRASRAMSAGWKRCWRIDPTRSNAVCSADHTEGGGAIGSDTRRPLLRRPRSLALSHRGSHAKKTITTKIQKSREPIGCKKVIAGNVQGGWEFFGLGIVPHHQWSSEDANGLCLSSLLMPRPCHGFPARVERFLSTVFRDLGG